MAKEMCGPKCLVMGLLCAVFMALGLFVIVGGIMRQWSGMEPFLNVALWYLGGFILFCIGKILRLKACPVCRV